MRLIEFALFLAPFAAFIIWRFALDRPAPSNAIVIGAVLVIALIAGGLVWFTEREAAPPGSIYVPAHLESGRIVSGHYEPR